MAVTRIKTNQLTDSSVTTAKINANAITAGKLEDNLTYGSNLTVTGNLTVNGTTTATNSTTVTVDDPVLLLGDGQTGAGALDLGFMGERGDDTNVAFVFDESADEFVAALVSDTDTSTTVTITDYADMRVGGLTVDDNQTVGGTLGVTGESTLASATISDLTSGRVVLAGTSGAVEDSGNLTFDGSTLAVTGAATISSTLGVTGAVTFSSTGSFGGDVAMGSNNITGLADPSNAQDAATKNYVDTALSSVFTVSDGSNSTSIADGDTVTFTATANETTVVESSGTITIGLPDDVTIGNDLTVTNDCTVSNDLTVTGNLTVNGTTTTVASTNTTVSDNLLELNSGATSNANDAGIIIERGSTGDNAIMAWDESADGFVVGTTTATASSTGDLTITAAGLTTAGLTATTGDFSGAVGIDGDFDVATNKFTVASATGNTEIAGTLDVTGESTLASATVSDLTSGRVVLAGTSGAIEDSGNLTFDGSTLAVTGAATISTTLGVTGVATFTAESVHNGGIQLNDSDALTMGTDDDATLVHDGSSLALTNGTGILSIDGTASSSIRVNEAGADVDFVVEGDTVSTLFTVDAGTDTVVIGGGTATAEAELKVDGTGSFMMPSGTTAQRPTTAVTRMMRWNTTSTAFEYYDGTEWKNLTADFTVIASETFDGDDTTTAFTLSDSQTTASCIVSLNGVVQLPTTAYGVSGTTLTFTEAPATGDKIEVRKLTTTSTVTGLDDGTSAATVTATASATVDIVGDVQLSAQGDLRFQDSDSSNYVAFQAPATVASNVTWTLPSADSSVSGYALVSDGSGTLSWAAAGATTTADTTSNTEFYIHFDNITSGAVTAVNHDTGLRYNPSTGTLTSDVFSGTATQAQYADLAEKYASDADIEPGTVVEFGGDAEITTSTEDGSRKVAGVISTDPAYMMNSGADGQYVALTGRVPCKVTGAVSKGDMMVSAGNGMARAEADPKLGSVIGKALEDFDGGEGVIEVVVGRM